MFIVAMTIAVLASVGVYALAAAATEVRMSGNERQNTQTHYLAEYGVLGVGARDDRDQGGLVPCRLMKNGPGYACASAAGRARDRAARTRWRAAASGRRSSSTGWAEPVFERLHRQRAVRAGVTPGSFGATPMNGDFFVELTEPIAANRPHALLVDPRVLHPARRDVVRHHAALFPAAADPTTAHVRRRGRRVSARAHRRGAALRCQ